MRNVYNRTEEVYEQRWDEKSNV